MLLDLVDGVHDEIVELLAAGAVARHRPWGELAAQPAATAIAPRGARRATGAPQVAARVALVALVAGIAGVAHGDQRTATRQRGTPAEYGAKQVAGAMVRT